jgi:hypothetical protein
MLLKVQRFGNSALFMRIALLQKRFDIFYLVRIIRLESTCLSSIHKL